MTFPLAFSSRGSTNGSFLPTPNSTIQVPSRTGGWRGNARINLFRGGRDVLARRAADGRVHAARAAYREVTNALVASVIRTYHEVLTARAFVRVTGHTVEAVRQELEATRVSFKGGGALRSEVLGLEARLAEALGEVVDAENAADRGKAALASLLGIDIDARFDLEERTAPLGPLPPDYLAGVAVALRQRPEIEAARARLAVAELEESAGWASFAPSLDARARYFLAAPSPGDFDLDKENWDVALTLRFELFRGLERPARIAQAEAVVRQMRARDRGATRAVQLDVKTAYLDLESARARREAAEAAEARATEAFRLVVVERQAGSATLARFLVAERDRLAAEIRALAAAYEVKKALAEVARSMDFSRRRARSSRGHLWPVNAGSRDGGRGLR